MDKILDGFQIKKVRYREVSFAGSDGLVTVRGTPPPPTPYPYNEGLYRIFTELSLQLNDSDFTKGNYSTLITMYKVEILVFENFQKPKIDQKSH